MLEFNPYFDISFLLFFLFIYFNIDIYRRTPRFFLLPSFDIVDDKNNFVEITLFCASFRVSTIG